MKIRPLWRIVALVCPLGSAACSHADACDGSFRVTRSIPPEERDVLVGAARHVNVFLGEDRITISDDGVCPIVKGAITTKVHGGEYVGYWRRDQGLTFDLDDTRRAYGPNYWLMLHAAAMHEYLHSLGLRHVPERGIMNPLVRYDDDFSAADLAECRRVDACD